MSGIKLIWRIRDIERKLSNLGLQLDQTRYQGAYGDADVVAVVPKDDGVPVYSRDAEVFVGTLEQLEYWLMGVMWDRKYMDMHGVSHKMIQRKEQNVRNKQLIDILKRADTKEKK